MVILQWLEVLLILWCYGSLANLLSQAFFPLSPSSPSFPSPGWMPFLPTSLGLSMQSWAVTPPASFSFLPVSDTLGCKTLLHKCSPLPAEIPSTYPHQLPYEDTCFTTPTSCSVPSEKHTLSVLGLPCHARAAANHTDRLFNLVTLPSFLVCYSSHSNNLIRCLLYFVISSFET